MRPAASQCNRAVPSVGKRAIGGVAIALQRAGEVHGNDVDPDTRLRGWFPNGKTHHHPDGCPSRDNPAWPVRDRVPDNQPAFHPPAHSRRPSRRCGCVRKWVSASRRPTATPARQGLPRQVNSVAANENLFLPVQRQMVAVFAHQNVRQQSGCGQTTILQTFWQRRDDRCLVKVNPVNVFAPNGPAAQKTRRFKIQLLADFLADATPALRRGLHRFGINDFFNHRQVLRQTRGAFFA